MHGWVRLNLDEVKPRPIWSHPAEKKLEANGNYDVKSITLLQRFVGHFENGEHGTFVNNYLRILFIQYATSDHARPKNNEAEELLSKLGIFLSHYGRIARPEERDY